MNDGQTVTASMVTIRRTAATFEGGIDRSRMGRRHISSLRRKVYVIYEPTSNLEAPNAVHVEPSINDTADITRLHRTSSELPRYNCISFVLGVRCHQKMLTECQAVCTRVHQSESHIEWRMTERLRTYQSF